jgi:hypothetical protein
VFYSYILIEELPTGAPPAGPFIPVDFSFRARFSPAMAPILPALGSSLVLLTTPPPTNQPILMGQAWM